MKNLSIIIPVYNEEKALEESIRFFTEFIKNNDYAEAIFIDDGSTDNTPGLLQGVRSERIRVITHPENKGYGAALKTGVKMSNHEYLAIIDADSSYPNQLIPQLFKKALEEGADMAVGARTGKVVEIGILRRFAKGILRRLAEYLSEEKIPDLNSGLRIVKKDLVLKFFRFLPNNFSFTTTITLSLLSGNYKIVYMSIDYYKRKGRSKIRPIKDTLNFLQLIVRTIMFFNPLKVFLPLSIFFMILSLAVLTITCYLGKVMDITTIILFTTGLNLLALGLIADLIDKRILR